MRCPKLFFFTTKKQKGNGLMLLLYMLFCTRHWKAFYFWNLVLCPVLYELTISAIWKYALYSAAIDTPELHQITEKDRDEKSLWFALQDHYRAFLQSLNCSRVSGRVCNAHRTPSAISLTKRLEVEMSFTFQLSLMWCAFLYKYLYFIHITWNFLEGKKLIDFRPFLIYSTA